MYSDQDIANLVARVQQLEGQAIVRQTAAMYQILSSYLQISSRVLLQYGDTFLSPIS